MRHVVYKCLSGYHSHGCAQVNTPKINFSLFIEDPYKISGLTYEPEIVDTQTSTYYCELGHYLKNIVSNGGAMHLLTTIVSEEFIEDESLEFKDVREYIFPLIPSKSVINSLVTYAYDHLDTNMCSSIYALKFAMRMLETHTLSPVTQLTGKPSQSMFDNHMERLREKLEKSDLRLKPEKILINDELIKIRKSSVQ